MDSRIAVQLVVFDVAFIVDNKHPWRMEVVKEFFQMILLGRDSQFGIDKRRDRNLKQKNDSITNETYMARDGVI